MANRLARFLMGLGVGPGQRVGLYFERSVLLYVGLLGVTKSDAAFVPMDTNLPDERIRFIAQDAQLTVLVTDAEHEGRVRDMPVQVVAVDTIQEILANFSSTRPPCPTGDPADELSYVVYTSGSTGQPKGVAITELNAASYLDGIIPVYGITPSDRVYQGIPISFDFSIDEIWPTWAAGATLIAGPTDAARLGGGLNEFLTSQRVTALHIVPTLLATLRDDLPTIRLVNVGGEPCGPELVDRFARSGRRMLNTYGLSETTVTATWAELRPGFPVTIGRPLPTHTIHVLGDDLQPVPHGAEGELFIGGPCVARGYLNNDELTNERFLPDLSGSDGARLYRSGDLVRLNALGDLEYLGRIDRQVKLRGYRIEPGEIETVILADGDVKQTVVTPLIQDGRVDELVAYVVLRDGADAEVTRRVHRSLKRRMPSYMVPAYIEILNALPMLPGDSKLDHSALPLPLGPRIIDVEPDLLPDTATEKEVARVWGEVLGLNEVPVDADFFLDLGGHSLYAALVMARVRQDPARNWLSIADLYRFPTVRELGSYIDSESSSVVVARKYQAPVADPSTGGDRVWHRLGCGAAQAVSLALLLAVFASPSAALLSASRGAFSIHLLVLLILVVTATLTIGITLFPLVTARPLLWRLKPGSYPLWGLSHFRMWLATKVLQAAPLGLLAGSPLIAPYLRLLGARVGRHAQIATATIGLPPFIEIGDGASIGRGASLAPFWVDDGVVHLASISVGAGVRVGTNAHVMGGARIEAGAELADLSLLSESEVIPAGERWIGSPATATAQRDPVVEAMRRQAPHSSARPVSVAWGYTLGVALLFILPVLAAVPDIALVLWLWARFGVGVALGAAFLSGSVFVAMLCGVVIATKRLVVGRIVPGVYAVSSIQGLRKWLGDHLVSTCLTFVNSLFATLYTPPLLRALGATIGRRSEVSTVAHVEPDALVLNDECFVADLAAVGPAFDCNGQVAVARTHIGTRSFIGNSALVSSDTRVGDGSLVGVLSTPPPGRIVDPGTNWLGSPAIFLPRRQPSEVFSDNLTFRPRPGQVAVRLLIEFVRATLPSSLFALEAVAVVVGALWAARHFGAGVFGVLPGLVLLGSFAIVLVTVALKWLVIGRYKPRVEPLWSLFVRRSELVTGLYESAAVPALLGWTTGTPFLGPALRLFGVHVGKGTFLDTTYTTEFDLLSIGDGACVGAGASLQTHLFEDRVMKMSSIDLASECTVGARAVVLYDTHVERKARIGPLSLAMKGETLPSRTSWRGIPARAEGH